MILSSRRYQIRFLKVESVLGPLVKRFLHDEAQAIAEYATMAAVLLVLVIGMITLIETNIFQLLVEIAKAAK